MKVKIGNIVYDPMVQPICIYLTEDDKRNIRNMLPQATKYCVFDEAKFDEDEIRQFMNDIRAVE
jgi:hypothetical protein